MSSNDCCFMFVEFDEVEVVVVVVVVGMKADRVDCVTTLTCFTADEETVTVEAEVPEELTALALLSVSFRFSLKVIILDLESS